MKTIKQIVETLMTVGAEALTEEELIALSVLFISEVGHTLTHARGGEATIKEWKESAHQAIDEGFKYAANVLPNKHI